MRKWNNERISLAGNDGKYAGSAAFSSLNISRAKKNRIVSSQEIDLLSRLILSETPLTPSDLSKAMGLKKSIISRLTEQLEMKRLLERSYDSKDKRVCRLSITQTGNQILTEIYTEYLSPVYALQRSLGDSKFSQLMSLIKEANKNSGGKL